MFCPLMIEREYETDGSPWSDDGRQVNWLDKRFLLDDSKTAITQ